jgi:hypothetical protein
MKFGRFAVLLKRDVARFFDDLSRLARGEVILDAVRRIAAMIRIASPRSIVAENPHRINSKYAAGGNIPGDEPNGEQE